MGAGLEWHRVAQHRCCPHCRHRDRHRGGCEGAALRGQRWLLKAPRHRAVPEHLQLRGAAPGAILQILSCVGVERDVPPKKKQKTITSCLAVEQDTANFYSFAVLLLQRFSEPWARRVPPAPLRLTHGGGSMWGASKLAEAGCFFPKRRQAVKSEIYSPARAIKVILNCSGCGCRVTR